MKRNPKAWRSVAKLATCSRCGDSSVAWVQAKSGKWYLATAYVVSGGQGFEANLLDPHFKHCPACICPTCEPKGVANEVLK